MPKLTKRLVDAARPKAEDYFIWDVDPRGFGIRIYTTGGKHYLFRCRCRQCGRQHFVRIGEHGQPWTVETARDAAQRRQVLNNEGACFAAERDLSRALPTVEDLCTRFTLEYIPRLKATTQRLYGGAIAYVIGTTLARVRVDRVQRSDVAVIHHELRHAPFHANRILAMLSRLFSWSVKLGLRETNPCQGIERYRETRRQRFLTAEELGRLGDVLRRADSGTLKAPILDAKGAPVLNEGKQPRMATFDPAGLLALRLLLLTGTRKGEVLNLKWSGVDLEGSCLRLTDSKTGPKVVPIGAPAVALLKAAPRIGEWVIPGLPAKDGKPERHRNDVKDVWNGQHTKQGRRLGIRDLAGLTDVRVHDLRHAFASVAVSGGAALPLVGALLGHREQSTTQRYAHAAPDPVRAVAEQTSTHIANLLDGPAPANVEPMRPKARRAR